ncbi:hypothetical protein [Plesiomonas shigelloides]|uniref:hypothetical protein n=1 Tax=Plesiomonas shigelloides TaxID=703 RepID=UPI002E3335C4|nr:hypothetical protein [Plesiomonas shigelloides]
MKQMTAWLLGSALAFPMLVPALTFAAETAPCDNPIFYAQTATHKKEVEICLANPSVVYRFGKTGVLDKEMAITVPTSRTSYAYQNNQVISIQEFTVRNGNTSYQVSVGTNDDNNSVASLYVYKGTPDTGKLLTEIKLDPDTMVNNIGHALADEGIAESDSL